MSYRALGRITEAKHSHKGFQIGKGEWDDPGVRFAVRPEAAFQRDLSDARPILAGAYEDFLQGVKVPARNLNPVQDLAIIDSVSARNISDGKP
jgi:hypothetical protein